LYQAKPSQAKPSQGKVRAQPSSTWLIHSSN
jgi:hypothetical protein